jgi:hypothetical protein
MASRFRLHHIGAMAGTVAGFIHEQRWDLDNTICGSCQMHQITHICAQAEKSSRRLKLNRAPSDQPSVDSSPAPLIPSLLGCPRQRRSMNTISQGPRGLTGVNKLESRIRITIAYTTSVFRSRAATHLLPHRLSTASAAAPRHSVAEQNWAPPWSPADTGHITRPNGCGPGPVPAMERRGKERQPRQAQETEQQCPTGPLVPGRK